MDEELDYLWETLGLEITDDLWPERDKIPVEPSTGNRVPESALETGCHFR